MSRTNNVKIVKKPYCKVCHDAGKPESVYTNHWVKSLPDNNGKTNIVCPTLLNTECSYCHNLGHTAKFCSVLEKNNKRKEKAERRYKSEMKSENTVKAKTNNVSNKSTVFAVLDFDSDNEQDEEVRIEEEFPSINTEIKNKQVELTGWAAIAAKPKVEQGRIEQGKIEQVIRIDIPKPKLERQTAQYIEEPKPAPWATNQPVKKSWADYSESESEDDWKTYEEEIDETW
jgi:hypothetical protein